jgi:putative peptidoglycan lipid II flippase
VLAASSLLAVFLLWSAQYFQWVQMEAQFRGQFLRRIGLMVGILSACAAIYFGACWASGIKLKQLIKR